jgi:hypothetical protein
MVINSTNINKRKESSNNDGQQFHQYQQINKTKESLISDGQQFHQYQQINKTKESLNSDGQQFHQYQQINKTKESLNSDGQQFHQYQQNEHSPLILTEVTEHKKIMTCDVGNPGPALGQAQKCGVVKPVNGMPTLCS